MARIEPIPFAEWPPTMRAATAALAPEAPRHPLRSGKDRPRAQNALGTLAHHPRLAKAFFTLNGHLMMTTTLSERQRELLVMRVAAVRQSSYEWAQHYFISREIGLDAETIARIAFGPAAPFWDPIDAALLRAADELIEEGGITAPTWSTLATELDTQQMLDVIFTVSGYDAFARMLRSCQVELDDDLLQFGSDRSSSLDSGVS
jgi:alkylhydroperoxidase family enzyme